MRIVLYVACRFLATSLTAQKLQDFSGTRHINPDKVVSKIYLPKTHPDSAPRYRRLRPIMSTRLSRYDSRGISLKL